MTLFLLRCICDRADLSHVCACTSCAAIHSTNCTCAHAGIGYALRCAVHRMLHVLWFAGSFMNSVQTLRGARHTVHAGRAYTLACIHQAACWVFGSTRRGTSAALTAVRAHATNPVAPAPASPPRFQTQCPHCSVDEEDHAFGRRLRKGRRPRCCEKPRGVPAAEPGSDRGPETSPPSLRGQSARGSAMACASRTMPGDVFRPEIFPWDLLVRRRPGGEQGVEAAAYGAGEDVFHTWQTGSVRFHPSSYFQDRRGGVS